MILLKNLSPCAIFFANLPRTREMQEQLYPGEFYFPMVTAGHRTSARVVLPALIIPTQKAIEGSSLEVGSLQPAVSTFF